MAKKGLERFKKDRNDFEVYLQSLRQKTTPEGRLTTTLVEAMLERADKVIDLAEQGRPFIASYYSNAPEIFVGMDLTWYMLLQYPFMPTAEPYLPDDIDTAVSIGLGNEMCTLIRLSIFYVEAGLVPVPTAFVGLLSPCDGAAMLNQALMHNEDWRDVPLFSTEPPYREDDRGIDFFAGELRRMVTFLEEHTGHRLDMDRLRDVVEESNRQYELWAEYNDLRRAVPCPHGTGKGIQAWTVSQNFLVGDPRGTDWFRKLVEVTEKKVSEGRGDVPDERIRLLWFDIRPVWFHEVTDWLKKEWGACIVMDMIGYAPYTLIDTSSEESIFRGLAKRNMCDVPMVRQARGLADNFVYDLVRIVRDYRVDCVVWPAHMGHKDGSASIGIMRHVCRDLGVPLLILGLDAFDKRYTTMEEIKDRFSRFFSTMGLG